MLRTIAGAAAATELPRAAHAGGRPRDRATKSRQRVGGGHVLRTEAGADGGQRVLARTALGLQDLVRRHAAEDVGRVEAQFVPEDLSRTAPRQTDRLRCDDFALSTVQACRAARELEEQRLQLLLPLLSALRQGWLQQRPLLPTPERECQ